MEVINGWEIQRDGRGFWACGMVGALRVGPFPRKSEAQNFARITPIINDEMPKPPKPQKTARRDEPNDDGE